VANSDGTKKTSTFFRMGTRKVSSAGMEVDCGAKTISVQRARKQARAGKDKKEKSRDNQRVAKGKLP